MYKRQEKMYPNNGGRPGDKLILTKPLGVGITATANRVGEASKEAMEKAIESMVTLNKYASEIMKKYEIHACTDVTGFSFLGHLHEMIHEGVTALIEYKRVPYIEEAYQYAEEFHISSLFQKHIYSG